MSQNNKNYKKRTPSERLEYWTYMLYKAKLDVEKAKAGIDRANAALESEYQNWDADLPKQLDKKKATLSGPIDDESEYDPKN